MIDVITQKSLQEAPAANCRELFQRLIPFRGKTLLVKVPAGRKLKDRELFATSELGELLWLRHEEDTGYIFIDLGGTPRYKDDRIGFVNTESSIWVELDGELRPVHVPEGRERKI